MRSDDRDAKDNGLPIALALQIFLQAPDVRAAAEWQGDLVFSDGDKVKWGTGN